MQTLMEATLRRPRRAPVGRGIFFRRSDGGVVHIVHRHIVHRLFNGSLTLYTVCGRRFELKGTVSKREEIIAAPLPRRFRACKACAAAMHRALEHFERGEL